MISPDERRVYDQMRHVVDLKDLLRFRIEGHQATLEQAVDVTLIARAQGAVHELRRMLDHIAAAESAAKNR
jgi:hypothetical protein